MRKLSDSEERQSRDTGRHSEAQRDTEEASTGTSLEGRQTDTMQGGRAQKSMSLQQQSTTPRTAH